MVKRMSIARSLPPIQLGYSRTELRRRLVDAVQAGAKTATAGLCADYESEGEALPKVGDRFLLLDYDDEPIAVVEATEVRVLRVADIDLAFARDEGEASRQSRNGVQHTRCSGMATRSLTTHSSSPSVSASWNPSSHFTTVAPARRHFFSAPTRADR
jgi:hypothetical protein